MRSFARAQQHIQQSVPAILPVGLLAASALSATTTPERHSLFAHSIAWLLVCAYHATRLGGRVGVGGARKRRLSLLAGFLYALAQVCDRAAADREGIWWAKSLLPLAVLVILRCIFDCDGSTPAALDRTKTFGFTRLLVVTTGTSLVALSSVYVRFPVTALGICSVLFMASALVILDYNLREDQEKATPCHIPTSQVSVTNCSACTTGNTEMACTAIRDMAAVVAIVCLVASMSVESFKTHQWVSRIPTGPVFDNEKEPKAVKALAAEWNWSVRYDVGGIVVEFVQTMLIIPMIRRQGPFEVALLLLGAILLSRITIQYTWWEGWLALLYAGATFLMFDDSKTMTVFSSPRKRVKSRHLTSLLAGASLTYFGLKCLRQPVPNYRPPVENVTFPVERPVNTMGSLRQADTKSHPIDQLIRSAESDFNQVLSRQSKSVAEAVTEYRRRYGLPPPPKFDLWYEFARKKGVQLIDEYDMIYETTLPFWGLEPGVIRARVAEAMGYDNFLLSVLIRGGEAVKVEGGPEWQQNATLGMMQEFVQHLPDMDILFNLHDEPRVILPADELARLVDKAKTRAMPAAFARESPHNEFSSRPSDLGSGKRIKEVKTTRFNRFAHQNTWSHSRSSCPTSSPARNFDEVSIDNITSYAYGELGFIYNYTAFTDICMSPSLRATYGFFDRPNAFDIVQDLIPIFSQSKISSFQDIVYPSPWYWANKVVFDKEKDVDWEKKKDQLYWRGSTTGGFSRNGGWRRQHRQRVVRRLNALDTANILTKEDVGRSPEWTIKPIKRKELESLVDVRFSHVGQCDPIDCDAQKAFFDVVERVDQQDAWQYKHLLDMDGNAFSGRFYAFLRSNSLVYKMSIFQEWHKDWLKPWLHYVPFSLKGDEHLEAVRFFANEKEGEVQAEKLAVAGTEWAKKALRTEDFEVWFFRLLLEYGRLVDDDRSSIGYSL